MSARLELQLQPHFPDDAWTAEQKGSRPMSALHRREPCVPDPSPSGLGGLSLRTIVIVIAIQTFIGFLITRGYTLGAALAASGAICALASRIGPRLAEVRLRRIV